MTTDYALGFRSLDRECAGVELGVEGAVPGWLDGRLIRNGPAKFEVGGERVAHWFDGLGMLHSFAFDGDGVAYTNRFLRSEEYREVAERGRMAGDQFGTSNGGLLAALRDLIAPSPTDNANVNVVRVGDRFVAVTETPVGIEFDPRTLETVGRHEFDLGGQTMTAHPHVDPHRGETVTMATEFGRTNRYRIYRLPDGGERFEEVGSVPVDRPAYVHSFALTERYAVVAEFPFDVSAARLLLPGGGSFIERYEWRPEEGTRFLVVDRETGEVVAEPRAGAFFAFHHVNAFEDGESIVVDLVAFEEPSVIDALYLDELESGVPAVDGELRRYRVPLDGGHVTSETLHDGGMALPRASPAVNARPYRYAYGQGTPDPDAGRVQRLVKVDTKAGSVREWREEGVYCGEPVFVPRPGGEAEDDGVVLSVILDAGAGESALLVLDGESFEEAARAPVGHVIPFDFHGRFFGG